MIKKNFHVWDVDDMYISSNPESKTGKQLRRKVYVERMDKNQKEILNLNQDTKKEMKIK